MTVTAGISLQWLNFIEKGCPVLTKTGIYQRMQAMDDMMLLREYATRNSEAAFAELVSRPDR